MLHKKLTGTLVAFALIISCTYNHTAVLPVGKSKTIDKTITLSFFKTSSTKKAKRSKHSPTKKQVYSKDTNDQETPFAIVRYSWTPDRAAIHLDLFEIISRENRKKGVGKQLFSYFVEYLRKTEPKVKKILWTAQALDPEHMSQETLESFYTSLGGTKLYSEKFEAQPCDNPHCKRNKTKKNDTKEPQLICNTYFSLELEDFNLTDTSLLKTLTIVAESNITRIKTLHRGTL